MVSGNLSTKTLIIDAGISDSQFEEKTLALFTELLSELNHSEYNKNSFEGSGPPELNFIAIENNIDAKKSLESCHLIFLIGNPNDIRFWQVRKTVAENITTDSYPILFTLPTGYSKSPKATSPYEFWIRDIGFDSGRDFIPTLIRDITAWESYPNFVGCDWTDINSAIGGQACRLLNFIDDSCATDNIDFWDDFKRFLLRHEDLLKRARGIFMLISIDKSLEDRALEIFQKLLAPMEKLLNDDCEIAWTDSVYTTIPEKLRVTFLVKED